MAALYAYWPAGNVVVRFQTRSSASSASCASAQPGCQSPGQPISELWLPGTETAPGWVTGPPPPGSPGSATGSPTTPYDEATEWLPLESVSTARYSSSV